MAKTSLTDTLREFYEKPIATVSLELLFSLVAIIALSFLAIKPTLLTISDLIKEIDDKKILSQQLSQKVAALQTSQTTYEAFRTKLSTLDKALPSSPQLAEGIETLEVLARESNTSILSLRIKDIPLELPPDKTRTEQLSHVLINLEIAGDFPALYAFIEALRSVRRLYVVDNITISYSEVTGRKQLQANLNINLQYFSSHPTAPAKK